MADYDTLLEGANTIKNETVKNKNTAARVGNQLKNMVESAPNIAEVDGDVFEIADASGNVALRIDSSGLSVKGGKKNIYLVGDSITQGQVGLTSPQLDTTSDNSTSAILQSMLGNNYNVVNLGCGGEVFGDISMRMGWCSGIIKKQFTLKGDCSEVLIFTTQNNASNPDIVDSICEHNITGSAQGRDAGKDTKSEGWINGIKVILRHATTYDETGIGDDKYSAIYTKRADVASYDVVINEGSMLTMKGSKIDDGVFVVMAGTNGNALDGDEHLKYMNGVLSKTQKVIFLSLISGNASASRLEMYRSANQKMKATMGDRYIDVLSYLASYQSFQELGVTPTTDDDISSERASKGVVSDAHNIALNLVPSTYWRYSYTPNNTDKGVDKIHLNKLGYTAIAKLINNKLEQLNWKW